VAVGCDDGDAYNTRESTAFRSAHPEAVNAVIADADGMLITGSEEVIRIWDQKTR